MLSAPDGPTGEGLLLTMRAEPLAPADTQTWTAFGAALFAAGLSPIAASPRYTGLRPSSAVLTPREPR